MPTPYITKLKLVFTTFTCISLLVIGCSIDEESPTENFQTDETSTENSPTDETSTENSPTDETSTENSPTDETSTKKSIWYDDDQEIRVRYFSFWSGGSRYRATRDRLTNEQLEKLNKLELTTNGKQCMADVPSYQIEIVSADGKIRDYKAGYEDSVCQGPDEIISMTSLLGFTGTYSCLSASQTRWDKNRIDTALTVDADPNCFHGFFGGPIWLKVNIDQPGTYLFREGDWEPMCRPNQVTLTVYHADGETLLEEGIHDEETDCWRVEHDFEISGTYFLKINGVGGDYFVQISKI